MCDYFVTSVFLQNNIRMGIILFLLVGAVDLVYFGLKKSPYQKELSYGVVLSAVTIIFITQVVTGNILLSVPLLIVAAAMSALFFDRTLIKLSFVYCALMLIAEYIILKMKTGAFVIPIVTLLECLVAIAACGFII